MTTIIISIFILGYIAIATEHSIKVNKAASALLTGVLTWTVYIMFTPDKHLVGEELVHHLGELSGILFFLMGAMTIVELVDSHDGFDIITGKINQTDKRKLLWIIAFITFFLSAILDNLTTTIVIVSLLRKLIKGEKERLFFVGIVVVAANAGGAWSPIGDVTTTMLWIGNQISASNIVLNVFLPSVVCLAVPLGYLSFKLKGDIQRPALKSSDTKHALTLRNQKTVLIAGVSGLVFVPIFKTITHLPPFMGILFSLGILWVIVEIMHKGKEDEHKNKYSVVQALRKIDVPSILFFLGILVSIAALESIGSLVQLAGWLDKNLHNENIIVMAVGLLSSIIDNVPLVAAAQGMYDLSVFPTDHSFWQFLAYCAGTGGSALIIGSAAGVAAMGMEKISFFWYMKNISLLALLGYFSGAVVYILQMYILG
jgi:Na+/H+ antiporter NhaD/arsenite permease-like protein